MSMNALIPILPLLGAAISGLFGRKIGTRASQMVSILAVGLSFLICMGPFFSVAVGGGPVIHETLFTWITSGDFSVSFTMLIDRLTAIMLLVVNGVSLMVHVYSVGYMEEDPDNPRFFAYLNLFTFAMLMLILGDNFLQMFLGWEGVGLASYLLIGFWFKKESACNAAIKAFLVNRVGDFGFALGIFAIYVTFGTLDYAEVFAAAGDGRFTGAYNFFGIEMYSITMICLLLFMGAMGKSAQLGLHTWLPDAMEGPTPVSALIHAATMVTAGVFMVARASPLFELSEVALSVVTIVGAFTAFFAATVALVQNDIKKVIAYSTCSQLGYMFFGCGVSAYAAGIFHLMTHGFFKALLFLGAGAVIHAMHHEQDMRKMGGLRKKLPMTFVMMGIGTLAITGFPYLFAGYYSKDAILESAWAAHSTVGTIAFTLGILAALMTTFYSFRLVFMTFYGEAKDQHAYDHAHEGPWVLRGPLVILSVGAVVGGFLGLPLIHEGWFGDAILVLPGHDALANAHHVSWVIKWMPFAMFLIGLALAYQMYIRDPGMPARLATAFPRLYDFLQNAWYFDALYDRMFVQPAKWLGQNFWKVGDEDIIDGYGVNGTANRVLIWAKELGRMQSGYIYHYAFAMFIGIAALVTFYA